MDTMNGLPLPTPRAEACTLCGFVGRNHHHYLADPDAESARQALLASQTRDRLRATDQPDLVSRLVKMIAPSLPAPRAQGQDGVR